MGLCGTARTLREHYGELTGDLKTVMRDTNMPGQFMGRTTPILGLKHVVPHIRTHQGRRP